MGSLLGDKVEGHRDVFFLTTVLEDVLVEVPSPRGAHHKIKPAAMSDYKCGVSSDYKFCDSILKISTCSVRLQMRITFQFSVHEIQKNFCCGV
jgi:hypothetical protein